MTTACNHRCKYCYEHSSTPVKSETMTLESFKEALDTAIYHRCILGSIDNTLDWHFHGGEVMLIPWETLKQMILYVEERQKCFPNVTWSMQSNGTLITDEIAKFFAIRGKDFGFSWDGFGDNMRMSAEDNQKLIDNLSLYHEKYNLNSNYLLVLSKQNMKTWIEDFLAVKELIGASQIGINVLCDVDDSNIPSIDELWTYWAEPVLKSFLTKKPIIERNICIMMHQALSGIVYSIKKKEKTGCFDRICAHGSNMTTITPSYNMRPCDKYLEYGNFINKRENWNIKDRDFLGLQTMNYVYHFYDKIFKEEAKLGCDSCYANAICQGECQSYNISRYGDVKIGGSFCPLYRKIYEFIEDNWIDILSQNRISLAVDANNVFGINSYAHRKVEAAKKTLAIEDNKIYLKDKE